MSRFRRDVQWDGWSRPGIRLSRPGARTGIGGELSGTRWLDRDEYRATVVAGELGTSPGTTITDFPPGVVTEGGATHMGDALALQAQSDVALAYNSSAGQACNAHLAGQELGGKTLTPDVYCFSSLAQLTGQLVFDAQGNAAAIWIIQIQGGLSTASNSSVVVTNGGGVCNVFWIVGESATIGAGSAFAGNILALTSITLGTGASLSGRALARNGAVTLDTNTINRSAPRFPPQLQFRLLRTSVWSIDALLTAASSSAWA